MATMKAIVVEETGGVDKLIYKDIPLPEPKEGHVVIKNHFVGIAGEISAVGPGVENFKVGDRVVYIGGSTYSEYSEAKEATVEKITNDISYETAAAIGIQALTAWTLVRESYPVKKGDYILIHAAAGGVGLLLCQMCRYLGATVIGTVSSAEKATLARENGADYVINYTEEDVVAKVNEITNGLGCHGVLDGVGKSTWEISLQCARRLGSVISFGNASGVVPPISISILAQKNLKIMRPTLFNYMATREESQKWWGEVFELLSKNVIKTHIYKIYELVDAQQAHIDIESRKTTGKLLLKP
ncbi:hypothetical protein BDA99DRAFT_437862 [Phascolomyces articulosus]|uniref:Probable quinone oxidoreductase n=1 Tax=Phascolomyces articulosus TaxID=60185 RepID=A0AAD5PE71_9FUNG|nr:hypothetical protein BDA99DRAFT_437862 [Phascolomyces articulosus]